MSSISVVPVDTRSDRKRFIAFPYELYKDERYWIPPLWIDQERILSPRKNAFFAHGRIQSFLATRADGEVVGMVSGYTGAAHAAASDKPIRRVANLRVALSLGVHPGYAQQSHLEAHGRGQVQDPVRHVLAQQGLFVAVRIAAVNGEFQLVLLVEQRVLDLRFLEIQPQGR